MKALSPFYPAMLVFAGAILVALGGFWQSWRQSNFNIEIRRKNEEIASLQRNSADAIIGGDSFAYVGFQIFDRNGTAVNANSMPNDLLLVPLVVHSGAHPLYDVAARIVDIKAARADIRNALNNYPVGNMTPGLAVSTNYKIPHEGKDLSFNIFFTARNGTWTQILRMKWLGDGWTSASKVVRGKDGKTVYSEVRENYPRNEAGEVDWGEPSAQN